MWARAASDARAFGRTNTRDGLEEDRVARRANAILSLGRGWGWEKVTDALLLDDATIWSGFKIYGEGGFEAIETFDFAGGPRALNAEQRAVLKSWATASLPASTKVVGHSIASTFGVSYTRSGLIKLLAAIDFVWRKAELVPSRLDLDAQKVFIERHETLRNGLTADEAIVYADGVHPTHQTPPALDAAWGRHRRPCGFTPRPDEHPRGDRP